MTARCVLAGTVAPRSQPAALRVRGVPVQPTRTPLGAALADLLASGVEPCPVCDRYGCDCGEWAELMNTDPTDPDPHGDLRALQAMEIPL